jgi:small GTP-binding protein
LVQRSKKVCLLGEFGVGKTSLVRRFVEDRFDERYLSTIGVLVSRKTMLIDRPEPIDLTLLIWDTAGSERFSTVVRSYYQGAAGALIVCDLTRAETIVALTDYAAHVRAVNPGVPVVLVGNKLDLASQREIADEQLTTLALHLAAPMVLSSARTGAGVEAAFQLLADAIV